MLPPRSIEPFLLPQLFSICQKYNILIYYMLIVTIYSSYILQVCQLSCCHRLPNNAGASNKFYSIKIGGKVTFPFYKYIHFRIIYTLGLCPLQRFQIYSSKLPFPDYAGELHLPSVQYVLGRLLDLHVQKSSGNEKQNIRRDCNPLQDSEQTKVSALISLPSNHHFPSIHA